MCSIISNFFFFFFLAELNLFSQIVQQSICSEVQEIGSMETNPARSNNGNVADNSLSWLSVGQSFQAIKAQK